MSGAVNDTKTTKVTVTQVSAPSWSPNSVSRTPNTVVQQSQCQRRPAVVRNPKDKFGWRKPSGWTHDWLRCTTSPTSFETQVLPGKSGWISKEGSSTTVFSSWLFGSFTDLPGLEPGPALRLNVSNTALTRALNKVAQKKWDLGVTARELRETVGLAKSLANQVHASARSLADLFGPQITRDIIRSRADGRRPTVYERKLANQTSRRAREQREAYEAARNQWMQYQFGLVPLAHDVDNASQALNNLRGSPIAVRGAAGFTSDYSRTTKRTPTNAPWFFQERTEGEFSCHYSLRYASPTDGVSPLTTLGLDNPANTLYQSARLSWALDYAFGIGDWLSSWTAVNGLTFMEGTKSTIWRAASSAPNGAELERPDLFYFVRKPRVRYMLEAGQFRREVITSPPGPAFAPQIKSEVGLVQLANSLFVLSSFAGGRSRG